MMSLTFGLFTQVSGSGALGPLVYYKHDVTPSSKSSVWDDFNEGCFQICWEIKQKKRVWVISKPTSSSSSSSDFWLTCRYRGHIHNSGPPSRQLACCTQALWLLWLYNRIHWNFLLSFRSFRSGCSKLTTWLVNVSLNFQKLISQIGQCFLLKKSETLLHCKSFSQFFNKKFQCIRL